MDGQLFRLDIDNVASSAALASKVRVVRLADFRSQKNSPGPRFYETPVVTIQNHNAVNSPSNKFATVSVASGNRSHPLRITDPSKHTVSLEIDYLDSLGHRQILRATHKLFLTTDDAGIKLKSSDWHLTVSDPALAAPEINNDSDIRFDKGQFQLQPHKAVAKRINVEGNHHILPRQIKSVLALESLALLSQAVQISLCQQ